MRSSWRVMQCLILSLLAACASDFLSYDGPLVVIDADVVCDPSGDFTLESTNEYFPMSVGLQWVLEGGDERVQITVLDETKVVAGVTTRVIEEREWKDDEIDEISRNFFAQASDGTICYFGEEVDPAEGVWRADEPGRGPGIIMPANPVVGARYVMEAAPGEAEDMGLVVGVGESISVPAGTFARTLRVLEYDPLDDEDEYKFFAAGVGIVIDEDLELVRY